MRFIIKVKLIVMILDKTTDI